MSLDDLLKGLSKFEEGMQTLAVGRGIRQAQEQVSQINMQEQDEFKKRQALSQVANGLVMQLSGAGANPQQIQQAAGSIMPPELKSADDFYVQGALTGKQEYNAMGREVDLRATAVERKEKQKDRDNSVKIAQIGVASARAKLDGKFEQKELEEIRRGQEKLNAEGKKFFESLQAVKSAKTILDSNNPIGDNMISAIMARASGEVGALTEADKAPYGGSQAVTTRLSQAMTQWKSGKLTDQNRAFLTDVMSKMELNSQRSINSYADRISKQKAALLKRDPTEIRQHILPPDWDRPITEQGQQQQQKQALPSGVPSGSVLTTRKLKGGGYRKVYQAPNGLLYPADEAPAKAAPQGFSNGGVVPGSPAVDGDSPQNDIVPIMASPGEIVIPRTVVEQGPQSVTQFAQGALDPALNQYNSSMRELALSDAQKPNRREVSTIDRGKESIFSNANTDANSRGGSLGETYRHILLLLEGGRNDEDLLKAKKKLEDQLLERVYGFDKNGRHVGKGSK
jgi:hypothetical protein